MFINCCANNASAVLSYHGLNGLHPGYCAIASTLASQSPIGSFAVLAILQDHSQQGPLVRTFFSRTQVFFVLINSPCLINIWVLLWVEKKIQGKGHQGNLSLISELKFVFLSRLMCFKELKFWLIHSLIVLQVFWPTVQLFQWEQLTHLSFNKGNSLTFSEGAVTHYFHKFFFLYFLKNYIGPVLCKSAN